MGEITYASGSLESLKALNLASIRSFTRIESFGDDEFPRPYSPSTPISSFNSVTFRQKGVRTKPRGFDEETTCSFNRWLQLDVQMDETIWQNLPEDLIVLILSRVPPFYLFRLRAVCTRWNFILQDKSFLAYHSQAPSHGPCLLTFSRNSQGSHCSAFSIPLKAWHRIPINFLPKWASWLVGSSGGLLCFAGWDGICFKILVCNPLTQKWKTLPMMHHNQQRLLILVTDRQKKFFKIIAANEACGVVPLPTEVYDSKHNSWTIHDSLPAVNVCSSKMVSSDSKIYLETLSPLGLMKFDMEKGRWEQIRAKFPRSLLDGYLVAGAKNRLFLVGRIGLYSTHQRVRIWELDHVKTAWVEIGKMPKRIFVSLRLSAERFDCAGQDNMICFTAVNPGKCLLYDVDKKTWSWISGCALHSLNSQSTFYEPRFDSSIH